MADRQSASTLLGAHMPTSGGVQNAITSGVEIGCTTVQLFTASPRQWRSPTLTDDTIAAFKAAYSSSGIDTTIAHDSYLINLAAPEGEIRDKSLAAFRAELERAELLGISFLVTHMGAHLGEGVDIGLARLAESINWLHDQLSGYHVRVALETTAGQGTTLGATFDQFPVIFNEVKDSDRLVVCMDTCHIFVAGYDIRTPETYAATLSELEANIGKDKLKVVHANDAQKPLGSKVDRHAHIGEGEIGLEAFRLLVNDPRFVRTPIILETPESDTMHAVNLQRLKDLRATA